MCIRDSVLRTYDIENNVLELENNCLNNCFENMTVILSKVINTNLSEVCGEIENNCFDSIQSAVNLYIAI